MTTTTAVHTVGPNAQTRAELAADLAAHPQVDLGHFPGWTLSLLHADVIVLGTDQSVGQEVLDMLKYFSAVKHPGVATFCNNDERMYAPGCHGGEPSFASRLEHVLRRASCREIVFVKGPREPAGLAHDGYQVCRRRLIPRGFPGGEIERGAAVVAGPSAPVTTNGRTMHIL